MSRITPNKYLQVQLFIGMRVPVSASIQSIESEKNNVILTEHIYHISKISSYYFDKHIGGL